MSIPNGLTPIPIVSGLALLQLGPADEWTGYVGLFSVVAVAVVVVLSKLGLLKNIGGNEDGQLHKLTASERALERESRAKLAGALDGLAGKVQQLDATIISQVRIMGTFTEEIRRSTDQTAGHHAWVQLQKQLETERRLRRGEAG